MKNEVHWHPDGKIIVRTTSGEFYIETPEVFEKDFGEKFPALPEGAIERLYRQNTFHMIGDGENVLGGGPIPWEFGERVLQAFFRLMEAHKARQPKSKTAEELKVEFEKMHQEAVERQQKLVHDLEEENRIRNEELRKHLGDPPKEIIK
jgi:hypothetical protein